MPNGSGVERRLVKRLTTMGRTGPAATERGVGLFERRIGPATERGRVGYLTWAWTTEVAGTAACTAGDAHAQNARSRR